MSGRITHETYGRLPFLGHVEPRVLAALEAWGWRIHRIGQAAYAHGDGHHWILGCWGRYETPPSWAGRLGRPSAGYVRRWERRWAEQAWRRLWRLPDGRFGALLPWYRWPAPVVYSWDRPT